MAEERLHEKICSEEAHCNAGAFLEHIATLETAVAEEAIVSGFLSDTTKWQHDKIIDLQRALSDAKRDAERLFLAAVILRGDFATHPPEFQQKWIHLPEFRASIDAYALAANGAGT